MRHFFSFVWEIAKIVIIALAIVIPIRYYLFQPFFVKGQSMEPSFESGDYLIVDELSYRFRDPQRGEVVVFEYPQDASQRFIKRVIGLPGEIIEIKDGKIIIDKDGKPQILDEDSYLPSSISTIGDIKAVLKEDEFFVLGDNRDYSFDSRRFGVVPRDKIIGRVVLRAWPFASVSKFEAPAY